MISAPRDKPDYHVLIRLENSGGRWDKLDMSPHCARCGVPIERHLVHPLACVDGQPHDFGDWKKSALPLSRFREFPGTLAAIVGIVAMIPTYDRPMHAPVVALSCTALAYIVMRLWYPPLKWP